ncbi:threonylcarbamoyl-AMP synthase [Toxorhynchites rutilus septentrionalis]|uniref:threonylcarbamoyl-AMP synthase n=1 Tax=Toxorhynchites rutilus septentrionalis TaxID=329112 RepID=UPI0024795942|nr:threonylcarbamoyl-AMP synthase [Toxorhynchites rutilus septentrionalis]
MILNALFKIRDLVRINQIRLLGKASTKMNGMSQSAGSVFRTSDQQAIRQAANLLESGQVIALPTDTVYGLACSANDPEAIQRLYAIKGRKETKPVAICVADIDNLRFWGQADHLPGEMLSQLLPGPVTIVVDKSANLDNPFLNPGVQKIGIRIPNFEFIRDVSRAFRFPIALTSANKSSEQSTLNVREFENLWSTLGAVFDGGQLGLREEQRAASTVIDLSNEGLYKVIRNGIAVQRTVELVECFGFRKML